MEKPSGYVVLISLLFADRFRRLVDKGVAPLVVLVMMVGCVLSRWVVFQICFTPVICLTPKVLYHACHANYIMLYPSHTMFAIIAYDY